MTRTSKGGRPSRTTNKDVNQKLGTKCLRMRFQLLRRKGDVAAGDNPMPRPPAYVSFHKHLREAYLKMKNEIGTRTVEALTTLAWIECHLPD